MGGRVLRWLAMATLTIAGLGPLSEPAVASGGGGCGRGVTDERGTEVRIKNYCFGPTILRVPRGETVTWVNRDTFAHTLLGANGTWGGYDELRSAGATARYAFVRSGVYPYVCTYHPGMIGAIVVGEATGRGLADTVLTADGPVISGTSGGDPEAERVVVVDAPPRRGSPLLSWAIGLTLATGALLYIGKRRRTSTA